MGEYAQYRGESIKIGTCENMYYLRADQRHLVSDYDFAACLEEIRFRFPFPNEDTIAPGSFDDHDHGVRIPGNWRLPADFEHDGSVQFKAKPGYLLSIPCPEKYAHEGNEGLRTVTPDGMVIHRNGWAGGYQVKQLKRVGEEWWTVVACGSCSSAWRLPLEHAESVAVAFRAEADRTEYRRQFEDSEGKRLGEYGHELVHGAAHAAFLHAMADRILAGYVTASVLA